MNLSIALDAFSPFDVLRQEEHPNKAAFTGVVTRLDEESTRAPNGSDGHKVLIPKEVAYAAGPSILHMPIDCNLRLDGHDKRFNIGIITSWEINGQDFVVHGHLFEKNFPDVVASIRLKKNELGMSYEISDVMVEDVNASVWVLKGFVFTGAAILRKDAAAYAKTAIAAEAEEISMAEKSELLEEIHKLHTKVDDIVAAYEEDDEEAKCRKDEEDATRHAEEAKAAMVAAKRAADDGDDEDAARHEEEAKALMAKAHDKRSRVMSYHASMAAKKRGEEDEEAAARHEEEAARVKKDDDEAKCHEEEASVALEAARKKMHEDEDEEGMGRMMGMFMRAMMTMNKDEEGAKKKKHADEEEDTQMLKMLRTMMKAMTYAPGMAAAHDAHDDEEEDKVLIRKMLKQELGKPMSASRNDISDMKMRRQMRDMQASIELLTDSVKRITGLLTDTLEGKRGLSTDEHMGPNGGPARKTMTAGGHFVDKYEESRKTTNDKRKPGQLTESEAYAELDKQGITDPTMRMAKIIELSAEGKLLVG